MFFSHVAKNLYNFSLTKHLSKELKKNNIKCKNKISYIDITLNNQINDYDKMIIDCMNGNAYLRKSTIESNTDNNIKDKKIFNLNQFNGVRESDAIFSASKICKQIIRYLNKQNNIKTANIKSYNVVKQSYLFRAFCYIDGDIYIGNNINQILDDYLSHYHIVLHNMKNTNFTNQEDIDNIKTYITELACGYIENDNIYIENSTLKNIDIHYVADLLKNKYPNNNIYSVDVLSNRENDKKIAKINKIYRLATHDTGNRDCALIYINGEIYENKSHAQALKQYLDTHNIDNNIDNERDRECVDDNTTTKDGFGFAHMDKQNKRIFIETDEYYNVDMNDMIKAFKSKYPDYEIYEENYDYNMNNKENDNIDNYKKIAFTSKNKIHRLAYHDNYNRDKAILYINGEVYTSYSHAQALKQYLQKHKKKQYIYNSEGRNVYDMNINTKDETGLGHVIDDEKVIFIEPDTLQNVDFNTVVKAFKSKYPNYNIYKDDENKESDNIEDFQQVANIQKNINNKSDNKLNNYKKIYRLAYHDYENRDEAALYINGKIYLGDTHSDCIEDYLDENESNDFDPDDINDRLAPGVTIDDLQNDNNLPLAFAHIDVENNAIFIETNTCNVNISTVANAFKSKFPNYDIYEDNDNLPADAEPNEYKKLANIHRLAGHDISNRDEALCYINGNIYTGYTHADIINDYIFDKSNELLNDTSYRPYEYDINNSNKETNEQKEDMQKVKDNIKSLSFGHIDNKNKIIYLEPDTMQNANLQTVCNAIKNKYPEYHIYSDLNDKQIVANNLIDCRAFKKKIYRLAYHDIENRDMAAVYIDGDIYTGKTHYDCIEQYLNENNTNNLNPKNINRRLYDDIINDNNLPLAFAHIKDNNVFIETDNIQNVDLQTVANTFKNRFSYENLNIYEDNNNLESNDINNYKQIAKVKNNFIKTSFIKNNSIHRLSYQRDKAIAIINGKVYTGDTHGEAISDFLKNNNIDNIELFDRDEINEEFGNNFAYQFAFCDLINDTIFVEQDTLQNINFEQVKDILNQYFNGYEIKIK